MGRVSGGPIYLLGRRPGGSHGRLGQLLERKNIMKSMGGSAKIEFRACRKVREHRPRCVLLWVGKWAAQGRTQGINILSVGGMGVARVAPLNAKKRT